MRKNLIADNLDVAGEATVRVIKSSANAIDQKNGTNAQTFNIYNTISGAVYEMGGLCWSSNQLQLRTISGGGGTARAILLNPENGITYSLHMLPSATDTRLLGTASPDNLWQGLYITRFVQGSKSKALTESTATTFVSVAVPQTAGANYAAGEIGYTIYATDGTDHSVLNGRLFFSAVNKAGTISYQLRDNLIGSDSHSAATNTLSATFTAAEDSDDVLAIKCTAVSSLVQTTFTIQYRLDMHQPNTVTPA